MLRLVLAGLFLLALSFAFLASPPRQSTASHVDPILFVHGYTSDASAWNTMISRFQADGWESNRLFAYTFSSTKSNASIAQDVKARVDQIRAATGAAKVDIITHSMGGLSSRYYLKNLGGQANVDDWVSLGGPNHGTDTADQCSFTPCLEMRIGSAFLTALNAGDETPGFPRYATWWSPCDATINPDSSVPLAGATNTQTACLAHNQLPTDAAIYQQVRDWVK